MENPIFPEILLMQKEILLKKINSTLILPPKFSNTSSPLSIFISIYILNLKSSGLKHFL